MSEYNIDQIAIGDEILVMKDITKIYGNGFVANNKVNFSLRKGEIHGLVGENGAGKSTLMKVLFGQETPESGSITFCNQPLQVSDPLVALKHGIGMVHQHFMLVESMTVAENMALGHEPVVGIRFDRKQAIEKAQEVSKRYNLPVNPNAIIRDLSVGYRQSVEILKMLMHDVKILLLDEPTAVLTPQETKELFIQLKALKDKGFSIVFISHKVNEVKEICDRITVLRSGQSVVTMDTKDIDEQQIANLIVGKEMISTIHKKPFDPQNVVLKVRDLSYLNKEGNYDFQKISFDLRQNEILGVAAIEGNGQAQLSDVLSGILDPKKGRVTSGEVFINNQSTLGLSIKELRNQGVSLIHEDRMTYGSSSLQSIMENLISDRFDRPPYANKGFINWKYAKEQTQQYIQDYSIKCDGPLSNIKTLSGGNVQKVVAAREFSAHPQLLIANQPTRGIDIGAADLIRNKMIQLRDDYHCATLLFSADLSELLSLSDTIMVLFEGQIVAYFKQTDHINEATLGQYMLGLKKQSEDEIKEALHE